MRRAVMNAAAVAALLVGGATGLPGSSVELPALHLQAERQPNANAEWRQDECRFGGLDPGGWTYREVYRTLDCAVSKWPVPGGLSKALDVAICESGMRAAAYNASGCNGWGCLGVFQQHARYWPSRHDALAPVAWDKPVAESGFDGRANVVVSIRQVRAQGGWSGWSCA